MVFVQLYLGLVTAIWHSLCMLLQASPETVAIVAMKNIPECNASFDPDHLGNICLFPSNRGGIAQKKKKNCSTFAVVIVTIGAMVRKPASQNQLMISSYWFANMLNYSCLIL